MKERAEYYVRIKFGHESGVETSGNLALTMFNKNKDTSGKIELDKSKRVNIESDLHARDNEAHFKFETIYLHDVSSPMK